VPILPEKDAMQEELQVFNKMFGGMLGSRRGNMTKQDVEAYKYTFSRYGKELRLKNVNESLNDRIIENCASLSICFQKIGLDQLITLEPCSSVKGSIPGHSKSQQCPSSL